MGGHLPEKKVTEEISRIRNKPMGEDVIAPSRFPGIDTKEDMKALVSRLRKESGRQTDRHKDRRRTHRERSGLLRICSAGFHNYRWTGRRHRLIAKDPEGFYQCADHICPSTESESIWTA